MKSLLVVLVLLNTIASAQVNSKEADAARILTQIGKKLSELKSVRYQIDRKIQYVGENYSAQSGGNIYLEFPNERVKSSLRFRLIEDEYTVVYNGKHYFILNSLKKEIDLNTKPGNDVLNSSSALYNSILTLRNVIPQLLSSSRTRFSEFDTIINKITYKAINIMVNNRYIGNTGQLEEFTNEYIGDTCKPYLLIVDPATYLPYQFITLYKDKGREHDHVTVTYHSLEQNPIEKEENSWYYSSFLSSYSQKKQKVVVSNLGKKLPLANLIHFKNNSEPKIQFPIQPGKPMVIEFWIKNCGYCMLAFPKLELLTNQYGKEIEFLSINTEDSIEDIEFFYNKHLPSYKMLYEGRSLAEQLQISSFPSVLIVDKNGVIVYAGSLDEKIIQEQIGMLTKK